MLYAKNSVYPIVKARGGLGLQFQPGNSSSRGPAYPLFVTIDYLHRSRARRLPICHDNIFKDKIQQ